VCHCASCCCAAADRCATWDKGEQVGCECVTVQAAAVIMLIGALLRVQGVHIEYNGVVVQAAATATAVALARVDYDVFGQLRSPLRSRRLGAGSPTCSCWF
jgi:predicted nucleotidyltransferase